MVAIAAFEKQGSMIATQELEADPAIGWVIQSAAI
jgi:hypothetical protein